MTLLSNTNLPLAPETPLTYILLAIIALSLTILPAFIVVRVVPIIKAQWSKNKIDFTKGHSDEINETSGKYSIVNYLLNEGLPVVAKDFGRNTGIKFEKVLEYNEIVNLKEGKL